MIALPRRFTGRDLPPIVRPDKPDKREGIPLRRAWAAGEESSRPRRPNFPKERPDLRIRRLGRRSRRHVTEPVGPRAGREFRNIRRRNGADLFGIC